VKVRTTDDSIRVEVSLAATPHQAWSLLTEKQHISNWWGDHVSLEARLGGKLLERWSDNGRQVVTSGEVTQCRPPSVLEMTWADDDWPGNTKVAFDLSTDAGGTRLVLEHSGWRIHPVANRWRLIDAHADGWSRYLKKLVEYASELGL
jgi:uncharacterized protein YndB with AHSA1/START domain